MKHENHLSYERILNHIKQEKIRPVYVFFGDENYLKESMAGFMSHSANPLHSRKSDRILQILKNFRI